MSNKIPWVDQRITCICDKKDHREGVIKGRFVGGFVIQCLLFLILIPLTVWELINNNSQAYLWLILVVLFGGFDLTVFITRYKQLKNTGHSVSCARKLAFAKMAEGANI
jgi:hypothetical protein